MSKFDKYRAGQPSKFDKYKTKSDEGWLPLLAKSAVKGATSIADIPKLVGMGAEYLINNSAPNYDMEYDQSPQKNYKVDIARHIPGSQDLRNKVTDLTGVDLEPKPTTSSQRIASNAIDFGVGSLVPGGFLNKGKDLARLAKVGTTAGATSGVLKEMGVNPLAADMVGIASPSVLGSVSSGVKNTVLSPKQNLLKIFGLKGKQFNYEGAKAAQDLGIELPTAVATDSALTSLANQYVSKTPYFGNKLKEKFQNVDKRVLEELDKVYGSVVPDPQQAASMRNILYNEAENVLPMEAAVKATNTRKALSDLMNKDIFSAEGVARKTEKYGPLIDVVNAFKKQLGSAEARIGKSANSPILPKDHPLHNLIEQNLDTNIKTLTGSKKALGDFIDWKNPQGEISNLASPVYHGILDDLKEYGKQNHEWYGKFSKAEKLHSDLATRNRLEDLLTDKSLNTATESLSHNTLAKVINDKKTRAELKQLVGPELFERIDKLGKVSQAMTKSVKNIPNPSGTATTGHVLGTLGGLAVAPMTTITSVIGIAGLGKLLTDKRFLDLAIKTAEKPNVLLNTQLNKRFKELTGVSLSAMSQHLNEPPEQ